MAMCASFHRGGGMLAFGQVLRLGLRATAAYIGMSFAAMPATAQETPLTFEEAVQQMTRTSPAIDAADNNVEAARLTQKSVSSLNRPLVSLSAQYVEYEKSLSLDLAGPRDTAIQDTNAFLDTIPSSVAPEFQAIASSIVGRISQALPDLFAALPESFSYDFRQGSFRPTVQALLPIYSGGAFPAIRRGAEASTYIAEARARGARELAQVNLIRVYFGQQTAQALENSTRESLQAMDDLLSDATKLEAEGFVPRSVRLEAKAARDAADRAYQRAVLAHDSARIDLANLLELEKVAPTTPLFVVSTPLPPASSFLGSEGDLPQTREAEGAGRLAGAAVDLAKSRLKPQAFAFGEYNLDRSSALPIEPDWIVGVGVRYTLLSNVGRGSTLAAARKQASAAEDTARAARKSATSATLQAWNLVESARRSFLLLDSSIAAGAENLRVQRISFREGEGTVAQVTAAEAALATARTQRIATAYEYDLALAGLLAASGRLPAFIDYLQAADIRIAAGPQR